MKTIPEIVQRAYNEGITDIGQLSKSDKYQLNKYVKSGYLTKIKTIFFLSQKIDM
jgi:hypothetical protein